MAVIQTIRDKYAKLAGGVIVLALLGFVLMDATSGGGGGLFGNSTTVAKVNGEKIDVMEYQNAIDIYQNRLKQQNPNMEIDADTDAQIRDVVFKQMINDRLMDNIYDKLGITVSKKELDDLLFGLNPDESIKQAFTNPQTGEYNAQEATAQIQHARTDPNTKAEWQAFEEDLVKRRYTSKFNALVSGAIYAPTFLIEDNHEMRNSYASINYVQLPYNLIADNQVEVTDQDLKKFMESRKEIYTIKEATRNMDVVVFNIAPSKEDSTVVLESLTNLVEDFANAEDADAFAGLNSEMNIPANYYTRDQLQSLPNAEELWNASAGSVVGPYFDGQYFALARVVEKSSFPDSVVCRHILVKTGDNGMRTRSDEEAMARMDSIVAMAKAGVPFDSLVLSYSDDQGSLQTGGEYTFPLSQRPGISKEFGDFVFESKAGQNKIVKVETNPSYSGYHYIEILRQGRPQQVSKIAFINKQLSVSGATFTQTYNNASEFVHEAKDAEAFVNAYRAKGLNSTPVTNINANSDFIPGVGASRELVRWAYEAKVGDISPVVTVGNSYVVAKLSGIQEEGLQAITDALRPSLEAEVKRMKKAEKLIEKGNGKTSLDAIAQAEAQQVNTIDSVNFLQSFIPNLGNEPKIAGYAFNQDLQPNTVSKGIAGIAGVYFIALNQRSNNAADVERNDDNERRMLEYAIRANAANSITNGLSDAVKVTDRRAKLFR